MVTQLALAFILEEINFFQNYYKYLCKWKERIGKSEVKSEIIRDQAFKQKKIKILQDNVTGLQKR